MYLSNLKKKAPKPDLVFLFPYQQILLSRVRRSYYRHAILNDSHQHRFYQEFTELQFIAMHVCVDENLFG